MHEPHRTPACTDVRARRPRVGALVATLTALLVGACAGGRSPTETWQRLDREAHVAALGHLLQAAETAELVAAATGWVVEERLAPRAGEPDEEVGRDLAGWSSVVDEALATVDDEAEQRWYRAVTLATLDAAEARARNDVDGPPWGILAVGYAHHLEEIENRWAQRSWTRALERFVVRLRWLQQDPDVVRGLAATDVPAPSLDDSLVDRWRDGGDVRDDEEVRRAALDWGAWLLEVEGREPSDLRERIARATEPITDPAGYEP